MRGCRYVCRYIRTSKFGALKLPLIVQAPPVRCDVRPSALENTTDLWAAALPVHEPPRRVPVRVNDVGARQLAPENVMSMKTS
jgi:hypothetical protein